MVPNNGRSTKGTNNYLASNASKKPAVQFLFIVDTDFWLSAFFIWTFLTINFSTWVRLQCQTQFQWNTGSRRFPASQADPPVWPFCIIYTAPRLLHLRSCLLPDDWISGRVSPLPSQVIHLPPHGLQPPALPAHPITPLRSDFHIRQFLPDLTQFCVPLNQSQIIPFHHLILGAQQMNSLSITFYFLCFLIKKTFKFTSFWVVRRYWIKIMVLICFKNRS